MNERTTRRGILAGALALVGGGAAVGAAKIAGGDDAKPAARAFTLTTPRLLVGDPDARPGMPTTPSRLEGWADLLDERGLAAGAFTSVVFPGGSQLELHTFALGAGTLLGMGSPSGAGFAVVGGTGEYAGASGAYVLEKRGDGSANFTFDLSA